MPYEFISTWLADWPGFVQLGALAIVIAILVLARYFLIAGTGFGVSVLIGKIAPWRRLQSVPFTRAQILREIGYSMQSVLVFLGVIGIIIALNRAGYAQLYFEVSDYGWFWFWAQIPLLLLIQDFYFYWMHRIVHMAPFYDRVHKTHHLSTNPSAFSAFAFHPLEAILEIAIFVVMVVVLPIHLTAFLIVGVCSLLYNVYGHLGYEIMPRFIAKGPIGYWLNKSAYHNQHHRTYRYNFGLYTVIWDRLHGTLHPHAESLFDDKTTNPSYAEVDNGSPSNHVATE